MKNNGTIWAWGFNSSGKLGNGSSNNSNVPVAITSLTGIATIAGGRSHSLAIKNDSTVWAWGSNNSGQLGNETNISSDVPVQVSLLTGITAIAGGEQHSLARKNDGTAWAWGSNGNGELGIGTNTNSNIPVQLSELCPVLSVNDITKQLSVSVFPNPSIGQFTLTLSVENGIVEIYNILGQRVNHSEITNQETKIDLSNQPKGIYFVKIVANQKMRTEKILIQ